jgi:nucleoside-diphosphate-sugar epimerase
MDKASSLLPGGRFSRFEDFPTRNYDVLINAISAGSSEGRALFETLERWDWKMIDFARWHTCRACVNISSGAAYGDIFSSPAEENAVFAVAPNHITPNLRYGLVKFMCEQRHRVFEDLPLVDIRLFAFFTRYIDTDQPFFMSDVVKSIIGRTQLVTNASDFARDFAHPEDFLNLILLCAEKKLNGCFDLYSRAPIKKSEIIALFKERYGLRAEVGASWTSLSGDKANYFSRNRAAEAVGYEPLHDSKDVLLSEADSLISRERTKGDGHG